MYGISRTKIKKNLYLRTNIFHEINYLGNSLTITWIELLLIYNIKTLFYDYQIKTLQNIYQQLERRRKNVIIIIFTVMII